MSSAFSEWTQDRLDREDDRPQREGHDKAALARPGEVADRAGRNDREDQFHSVPFSLAPSRMRDRRPSPIARISFIARSFRCDRRGVRSVNVMVDRHGKRGGARRHPYEYSFAT